MPSVYKLFPYSKNKTYIYVLGESTSWGEPYGGKYNYSKILNILCDGQIDNKEIEIINLSKIGNKLFYQYKTYLLYKFLHPFKKGIVLAYMGTNIFSVKKYDNISPLRNFMSKIYSLSFIDFLGDKNFRQKYEKILKLGMKFGDEFYISAIAGNYSAFFPEYYESLTENSRYFKETDVLIENNKFDEALKKLTNSPKYFNMSQTDFRYGKIYEKQNKVEEANKKYLDCLEYDNYYCPIKPGRYQNLIIKELAEKYDIPYFDFFGYLIKKDEVIGFNFFIDDIHPDFYNTLKIAQEFKSMISKKHIVDAENNIVSMEQLFNNLNFTNEDLFKSYLDSLGTIFVYSYFSSVMPPNVTRKELLLIFASNKLKEPYLNIFNIEIMEKYIDILYRINEKTDIAGKQDREQTIHICETILAYITGDTARTKELIINNNLKDIILKREQKGYKRMQCWWFMKHWLIDFIAKNKI